MTKERQRWTHGLTGYHWFVFLVASAAWFFDCLDQRLFSLARIPALTSLMPPDTAMGDVQATGKEVTAVFLIGWGIGGLIFGALGDRYGRARMLTITVLIYSVFTGLTFFSQTYWDFAICRFLTGLGRGRRVRPGRFADCRNAARFVAHRRAGHAADALDDRQYRGRSVQYVHRLTAGQAKSSRRAKVGGRCFSSARFRRCS